MKLKIIYTHFFLMFVIFAYSQPTTVYTCKGGTVAADIRQEFTPQQITDANNNTMSTYSYLGITFLDNSSYQYNCHSYAWHLREGNTNKVWINNATPQVGSCFPQTYNIDKYWTDGCFIKVCNEADADKLHYFCGDHSAVKSTTNPGFYESKWGQLAVVRHTKTNVPYAEPVNSVNYYASTKVSGSTTYLCSGNRAFSVKNISGTTYTWTYSSSLVAVGPINTNQITVQRNGSLTGNAWVSVQISTPCSTSPVTSRLDFLVGNNPVPVGTTVTFQGSVVTNFNYLNSPQVLNLSNGQNGYASFKINDALFTNLTWSAVSVDPGTSWTILANSTQLDISIPYNSFTGSISSKSVTVRLNAQGPCGAYTMDFVVRALKRGASFVATTVEPNPATSTLTIAALTPVGTQKITNGIVNNNGFDRVQIVNKMGNIIIDKKYPSNSKKINIDVSALNTDFYIVRVFSGISIDEHKIIVQH